MESFVRYQKLITLQILTQAALVALAAMALGYTGVAKGFVLGSFFSLANLLIMAWALPARLGKSGRRAGMESSFGLLVRLFVMGCPIYIAFRHPEINLISVIFGLFNLQFSVLIQSLVIERFRPVGSINTP